MIGNGNGRIWRIGPLRRRLRRRLLMMRDCDFLGGIANDKVVLVHTQPIFSVVDGNQVLDQVFVGLAYTPAFSFLRAENVVVVQRIINYGIT